MNNMITYRPIRRSYFPETRFFVDFMRPFFNAPSPNMFRVDVVDNGSEYILKAELPGVSRESIRVNMDEGVLSIRAERNEDKKDIADKEGYILSERRYASVERSFRVENIAEEGITARYADGILTLTLPKITEEKKEPRTIEIQ